MATLTQFILAAVMNFLGIVGEIKENCATQDTRTVTEVMIPSVVNYYSCYKEENSCIVLTKADETITKLI